MSKYLIINADDFGMSPVFNTVILDLAQQRQISSSSVMVNRVTQDQDDQVRQLLKIAESTNLSIGLHLEFVTSEYPKQIRDQYQHFQTIFGTLPSHIDIHKAHTFVDSFNDVAHFCKENNLALRNSGVAQPGVTMTAEEAFFGSVADFSQIEKWLKSLEDGKFYEILFHPGKYDPSSTSSLNTERERDVEHVLKLNSMRAKNDIRFVNYWDLQTVSNIQSIAK